MNCAESEDILNKTTKQSNVYFIKKYFFKAIKNIGIFF